MSSVQWSLAIGLTAMISALYCLVTLLSIRLRKHKEPGFVVTYDELVKLEQRIDRLQGKFIALQSNYSQSGLLSRQLEELEERMDELDLRGDGSAVSYQMASRLAKRGIAVDELAKTCGMTKGEAELLRYMKRA